MRIALTLATLVALLSGCQEHTFFPKNAAEPDAHPGSVLGRVCDPSGRTWLADVLVYTNVHDSSGMVLDTRSAYTDRDGYFLLSDLPADRDYIIYAQHEGEILSQTKVFLEDSMEIELEEPRCFEPLQFDVAVITGDYDEFQDVLGNMGFGNLEVIDGLHADELKAFLLNLDAMLLYDIIFFNGGHVEEGVIYASDSADSESDLGEHEQIMQNIRDYVAAGGTIYTSDWAYDVVEIGWPDAIDFVGPDEVPDAAQLGEYGLLKATVADEVLAEQLGKDHIDIEYDLPVWPAIEGTASTVSVHLTGTIEYREGTSVYSLTAVPLLASFTSGSGKVVVATFRTARNADADVMLTMQYMMYQL